MGCVPPNGAPQTVTGEALDRVSPGGIAVMNCGPPPPAARNAFDWPVCSQAAATGIPISALKRVAASGFTHRTRARKLSSVGLSALARNRFFRLFRIL